MARAWKWVLGIAGGLFTLVLLAVAFIVLFFQWDWLKQPASDALAAATGRNAAIEGHLQGEWALRPRFVLENVFVANAEWAREPEMLRAERVEIVVDLPELLRGRMVLPEIRLVKPAVSLERRPDGEVSWTFGAKAATEVAAPETRTEVPLIGRLAIEQGKLVYRDAPAQLDIDARIDTAVGEGGEGQGQVRLDGQGRLHGEPFKLTAVGGSLLSLRDNDEPYPLTLELTIGPTRGRISGTLAEPVRFEGLDLQVALSGPDLARLSLATGVALPATPPYDLKGRLRREGAVWGIGDLDGKVGNSDLKGDIRIDTGRERPYIEADLTSKRIDYRDIGPLIGIRPDEEKPAQGSDKARQPQKAEKPAGPPPRVLPDAPLMVEQVRATDAKVRFHGDKVEAPNAPLSAVDLQVDLQGGVLRLKPLRVGVAGGRVDADIRLDARTDNVRTDYDVRLVGFALERFLQAAGLKDAGRGRIDGRIRLVGFGDTVRKSLGSANGELRLVMNDGAMSNLALELIGIDVAEASAFWVGGDKTVPLRCFVADFAVERGMMAPRTFVLDTTDTTVTAEGKIDLATERLALKLVAHPKDPSPLSARTPITINGMFSRPEVGLDAKALAGRTAGAIALGVLLTPLAAILAFIEPGLEKDADCAALMHEGEKKKTQ